MKRARLVPLAGLLSLALALPAGAAPPAPPEASRGAVDLAVTGFALQSLRPDVVRRDADALSTLTVAGVSLTADGRGVAAPTSDAVRLAGVARRQGLAAELIVSNYSNRDGGFDPVRSHRLLSSAPARERVAAALARRVADGGWSGVNVDLELVRRGDAAGLTAFVRALQEAMPAERTVSIDVSAATSARGYRDRGYDLAGLAEAADVVVLMAYDQHGPTWSDAGPIGSLRWQREAAVAMLEQVPAEQVDLGVAGYGYTWPRSGSGTSVSVGGARKRVERAGVRAVWHPGPGEWSARLPGGTEIWWSDARSYRHRVALARDLGLHGVAIWRLGSADPL